MSTGNLSYELCLLAVDGLLEKAVTCCAVPATSLGQLGHVESQHGCKFEPARAGEHCNNPKRTDVPFDRSMQQS